MQSLAQLLSLSVVVRRTLSLPQRECPGGVRTGRTAVHSQGVYFGATPRTENHVARKRAPHRVCLRIWRPGVIVPNGTANVASYFCRLLKRLSCLMVDVKPRLADFTLITATSSYRVKRCSMLKHVLTGLAQQDAKPVHRKRSLRPQLVIRDGDTTKVLWAEGLPTTAIRMSPWYELSDK